MKKINFNTHNKLEANSFNYYLINLIIFLSTIPYVSFYPIYTDIQPLIFIAAFFFILNFILTERVRFSLFELYFFFTIIISFFYVNIFNEFDYIFQKRISFLFAFFIYFSFTRFAHYINFKFVFFGILINFVAACIHYYNPALFSDIISGNFIRIVKIKTDQDLIYRGVSGLTTEPSFLSIISLYFVVLTIYYKNKIHNLTFYLSIIFSFIILFLSNSGTGFVVLFTFTIFYAFFLPKYFGSKIIIAAIICVAFLIIFSFLSDATGRMYVFIDAFIKGDLFSSILKDSSFIFRLISLSIGLESFFNQMYLFGHGAGSINYRAPDIALNSNWVFLKENADISSSILSSFGYYLFELGIIFLLFFIFIISKFKINVKNYSFLIFVIICIIFSFSIAFPPIWILIAIAHSDKV